MYMIQRQSESCMGFPIKGSYLAFAHVPYIYIYRERERERERARVA